NARVNIVSKAPRILRNSLPAYLMSRALRFSRRLATTKSRWNTIRFGRRFRLLLLPRIVFIRLDRLFQPFDPGLDVSQAGRGSALQIDALAGRAGRQVAGGRPEQAGRLVGE